MLLHCLPFVIPIIIKFILILLGELVFKVIHIVLFVIILSLEQDFLPSSWAYYKPTWVDMGMMIGSFGLFFTLFLLFIRFLPVIAIAEVKAVMPQADPHAHHHDDHHDDNEAEAQA